MIILLSYGDLKLEVLKSHYSDEGFIPSISDFKLSLNLLRYANLVYWKVKEGVYCIYKNRYSSLMGVVNILEDQTLFFLLNQKEHFLLGNEGLKYRFCVRESDISITYDYLLGKITFMEKGLPLTFEKFLIKMKNKAKPYLYNMDILLKNKIGENNESRFP